MLNTSGEDGKELIRQAINAHELSLQIRTRDRLRCNGKRQWGFLKIAKKALEEMR